MTLALKDPLSQFNLPDSWANYLRDTLAEPYFFDLIEFVQKEREAFDIYPPESKCFNAFEKCSFEDCRVVILGQDPYHGPNQANGLCFSVNDGIPHPPSLKNIFKELEDDLRRPMPESGNLEYWASQGVLMLNATLTVRANQPGSHQNKGWETFTDEVN